MTLQDAINIVARACASLQADLTTHQQIQDALQIVCDAANANLSLGSDPE